MTDLPLTQWILDCNTPRGSTLTDCALTPFKPPPATVTEYAIAGGWTWVIGAVVVLAAIIAIGIIWFQKVENGDTFGRRRLAAKKAELDAKARIAEAHTSCQNCGVVYSPKLKDIEV